MTTQTSRAAYIELILSGKINGLRRAVIMALAGQEGEMSGMTQSEVWSRIRAKQEFEGRRVARDRDSITPRFAELVRMDIIEVAGVRRCAVTGHACEVFRLTFREPRPLVRAESAESKWKMRAMVAEKHAVEMVEAWESYDGIDVSLFVNAGKARKARDEFVASIKRMRARLEECGAIAQKPVEQSVEQKELFA